MKQTTFTILLAALVVAGCSKSSTTKSNSSSSNNSATACLYDYYTNPQCPGYASTTGGTTSGATTGSTGGGNYTGMPDSNNNWASRYNTTGKPTASSTINCSAAVNQPNGLNYAPRKGTVHMAFRSHYRPDLAGFPSYANSTSYFLTSVNTARDFLDSDAHLKVRFMPRPQRVPSAGDPWCYGRKLNSGSGTAYGYTELTYTVGVYGIQNGTLVGPVKTDYLTTAIQTCSPAIDYSGQAQQFPEGIVLTIFDVYSNQGCGSYPCSALSQTSTTCWGMDVEVATDATKTFQ
jgi:hypothetical protein